MKHRLLSTTRGQFGVWSAGTGAPLVVLLHPLALSGQFWSPVADVLATTGRVVALDARGHGTSPWDGSAFTIDELAEDVHAVVTELEPVGPVSVMGASLGGCIALALAARNPDLVARLALVDTTANYGPDRVAAWQARAERALTPREDQVPFQHERWFSEAFRTANPPEVDRVSRLFLATDSRAHAAMCRAMGAFDVVDRLPRISADTLVVVGEHDQATPVGMARQLADGLPTARLEVVPGAHHFAVLERPDLWPVLAAHLAPADVDAQLGRRTP